MSITTSQQIIRYYSEYGNVDVTFTKEVIKATGLQPKQVFIKFLNVQWPVIIYSASLTGAKVIATVTKEFTAAIRKANNMVFLRYSFKQSDKIDPITFFVQAKINGFSPYSQEKKSLNYISLSYTSRPPDDLIEILGRLLEANVNSKKRKEERIILTPDVIRKTGIKAKNTMVIVEGVPRKCILRDISFSGAKVLIMGVAKFLINKEAVLQLEANDPPEKINIKGTFIRHEPVEGRKDIAAFALQFKDESVPVKYKIMINDYLKQRKISK